MFHPVGSQPPSVYWRRRLLAAGAMIILLVLAVVTVSALSSSGSPAGGSSTTPVAAGNDSSTPRSTPVKTSPKTARTKSTGSTGSGSSAPRTGPASSGSGSPTGTVEKCSPADLQIAASVGQQAYHVGQDPMVGLKVTNIGSAPCVQDLADKQVVLKVYNGVSRVWGSHDCQTQPGTQDLTLAVGKPVLASVSWSGETSKPKCAGTRQHVGAGTYTLIATLAGKTGTAARFTIS